MKISSEKWKKK